MRCSGAGSIIVYRPSDFESQDLLVGRGDGPIDHPMVSGWGVPWLEGAKAPQRWLFAAIAPSRPRLASPRSVKGVGPGWDRLSVWWRGKVGGVCMVPLSPPEPLETWWNVERTLESRPRQDRARQALANHLKALAQPLKGPLDALGGTRRVWGGIVGKVAALWRNLASLSRRQLPFLV